MHRTGIRARSCSAGPPASTPGPAFPWLNVYQAGPGAAGGIFPYGIWLTTQALIVATGMFLGAPLLAREYQQGTFRFAWTQGMVAGPDGAR